MTELEVYELAIKNSQEMAELCQDDRFQRLILDNFIQVTKDSFPAQLIGAEDKTKARLVEKLGAVGFFEKYINKVMDDGIQAKEYLKSIEKDEDGEVIQEQIEEYTE